jgi:hypothetical protein
MTNKGMYPANWRSTLARRCKEAAGWCCEECGAGHRTLARSSRTGYLYVVYLQAAHVDHDQLNPDARLRALCPTCHARLYRRPKVKVVPMVCARRRRLRRLFAMDK